MFEIGLDLCRVNGNASEDVDDGGQINVTKPFPYSSTP